VGRVALFAGDGRRLASWAIERCRPHGLVHLGGNLLVGCGSYPTAVVDLGDRSVVRVKEVADRVSRSIDGAYAVTSGRDGYAVWRAGARRPERVVEDRGLGAVAVSATGEVAFARAGRVFTSGGELGGPASELACSADGLELAGRSGSRLWRWDLGSGAVAEVEGHETRVRAVALSDDGRCAVSGSIDGEVCRWDVAAPSRPVRCWSWGSRADLAAVAVAGDRVVGAADRTVRVFGERDWELPSWVTALSTDGGELFARVDEQQWYRLEPDGAVVPVEPRESHEGPYGAFPIAAAAVAWSAAGFVTGHDDGTVRVWGFAP
jgi:hypothetical protein